VPPFPMASQYFDCLRAARSRCADFGEPTRSVAARISSETGFSLDAGLLPEKET